MDMLLAIPKRLVYWWLLASDDGAGFSKFRSSVTGFDTWMTTGIMLLVLSPISLAALLTLWLGPVLAPYGVPGPTVFLWSWIGPAVFLLVGAIVRGALYRSYTLPFTTYGQPTAQLVIRPVWAGRTWTWTLVAVRYDGFGARFHSAKVLARGSYKEMIGLMGTTHRTHIGMGLMGDKVSP